MPIPLHSSRSAVENHLHHINHSNHSSDKPAHSTVTHLGRKSSPSHKSRKSQFRQTCPLHWHTSHSADHVHHINHVNHSSDKHARSTGTHPTAQSKIVHYINRSDKSHAQLPIHSNNSSHAIATVTRHRTLIGAGDRGAAGHAPSGRPRRPRHQESGPAAGISPATMTPPPSGCAATSPEPLERVRST